MFNVLLVLDIALVPDYGPFGLDFYGPKDCNNCKGTGRVRVRNKKGKIYMTPTNNYFS
jgi:hypothetical protein